MAKKPTIATLVAGYTSASRLNTILQSILTALDNTVSRDGSTPNTMEANLDLNSNDITNANNVYANKLFANGTRIVDAASLISWRSAWETSTSYSVDDLVREEGTTYICLVAHTSGTFSSDLVAGYWEVFAQKGASGEGTGDMVAANNLSDVSSAATSRSNLGLGTVAVESTVPVAKGGTGSTTASGARTNLGLTGLATVELIDEDDMASDSATRPPSQQSVKAYVDASVSTSEATTKNPFETLAAGSSIRSRVDTEVSRTSPSYTTLHTFNFLQFGTIRVTFDQRAQGGILYPDTATVGTCSVKVQRLRNGTTSTLTTFAVSSPGTGSGSYSDWTSRTYDVGVEPGDSVWLEYAQTTASSTAVAYCRNARFQTNGENLWPGVSAPVESNSSS